MESLKIDNIRLDGGTQPRSQIEDATVIRYAAAMKDGHVFPPVTIFHDGSDYWLADGFHRVRAAQHNGACEIESDVHQGTRRDAVLFSVSANITHGVPRTTGDTRRAVEVLLSDGEWSQWSNMEIARRCGCSESYVRSLRKDTPPSSHTAKMRTVERNGRTFKQKTGKIGNHMKGRKPPKIAPDAFKPVRGHSNPPPMVPLSLPKENPQLAAGTLIELFNTNWLTALVQHISEHLQSL